MRLGDGQALGVCPNLARAVDAAKSRTPARLPARLYVYETLLERLPQALQDMTAALGPFIQEAHAVMGRRHVARHRHLTAADQPRIREGVVGARHGRVVTKAVRSPVRPATL